MAIFRDYNVNPTDHDRTIGDRRRHRELVEKAIKENLADILSEESIVGQGANKKIKIPIRGLKEYEFIYGKNSPGVGSGDGSEKRGDSLGKEKVKAGKGKKGAGNEEGEDIYETEVTIEDVINYLIEDLNLPNLDKKKYSEIITESSKRMSGYQKYGIRPRLAKKKTVIEKLKREQGRKRAIREADLKEDKGNDRFPFREEDLRYHKIKEKPKKECNAAIMCIMDCSGSMDTTKKYLARSFFFILSRFIRLKYVSVEITFISHSTVGHEVNENDFFHKVESGGTYISSGINKALEIIEERYNPDIWNIYGFYVSDGDNFTEDDERALKAFNDLCTVCNMVGYAEILPYTYSGTMKYKIDSNMNRKNFISATIKNKEDLWPVLKAMLIKDLKEGES
ncbi:sporulation protein YhbH [Clostridium neuense]|uniref:UPF0229 protein ACJDT4_04240 n=1 Tax=Clostridium neuense TaxID=1728934 RepID=A0ABW8TD09_9CLOT